MHTKQSCKWGVLHIDRNIQQQGCQQHFRFLGSTTWTTHGFLIATKKILSPGKGNQSSETETLTSFVNHPILPVFRPQKIGNMWEVCFASCPVMSTVSRFTTAVVAPLQRDHLSKSSTLLWDILRHVWAVTVFLVWASNYSNDSIIKKHHDFGTSSPLSWKLFSGTQKMDEKPRFHHEFPKKSRCKNRSKRHFLRVFFHVTLEGSRESAAAAQPACPATSRGLPWPFPCVLEADHPGRALRPGSLGSLVKLI